MHLHINPHDEAPVYRQIQRQIANAGLPDAYMLRDSGPVEPASGWTSSWIT